MTAASVVRALQSIGVKDLCLLDKVLLALNVDPYDEAKRYVAYDRFVRVMNMALKAAIAPPCTAASTAAATQTGVRASGAAANGSVLVNSTGAMTTSATTTVRATSVSSQQRGAGAVLTPAASIVQPSTVAASQLRSASAAKKASRQQPTPAPAPAAAAASSSAARPAATSSSSKKANPAPQQSQHLQYPHPSEPHLAARARSVPTVAAPVQRINATLATTPATLPSAKQQAPEEEQQQQQQGRRPHYDPYSSTCTFTPSINTNIDVSAKGPVTRERFVGGRSLTDLASKLQKEMLEEEACTFKPQLSEIHGRASLASSTATGHHSQQQQHHTARSTSDRGGSTGAAAPPVGGGGWGFHGATPGFNKAIQRMARGRQLSVQPFEEMLRSSSSSRGGGAIGPHMSVDLNACAGAAAAGPTEVQPFRLRSDVRSLEREAQKPLLYVDVDLPHGKSGRIGVHRGDDAACLARNFCASYSLDTNTVGRLTAILQEKVELVQREKTRSLWL